MLTKSVENISNINLSLDEYFSIIENHQFAKGGESIICRPTTQDTLYKFFIKPNTGQIIDMPDNKVKKIKALYELKPQYMVQPLKIISTGSWIVGYEMSYNPDSISLSKAGLSRKEKIETLIQAKTALQYFASIGITYGDIKSNNILIDRNTGQITFCDIDNTKVGENPIDLVVEFLGHFSSKYGRIDSVADAYMHNILTLQQLGFPNNNPTYKDVVRTLEAGIYPKGFYQEARQIFESMTNPKNFNGEYVIQYVKK